MSNNTVESFGVNAFKNLLLSTERVDTSDIHENDKTPSWDGNLIIYNNIKFFKSNIVGKIPIQIKSVKSNSKSNKFSICKQDLLNYEKEGFVFYVYIRIKDDFTSTIYYLQLQLLDIERCLSKYGDKKYKSFEFLKFPSDPQEILRLLYEFIEERSRHKQLIPNVQSMNDLIKVKGNGTKVFFDIKTKTTGSIVDIVRAINNQKPYIRYHSDDVNLDFPVDRLSSNVEIFLNTKRTIRVNDMVFYEDVVLSSDGSSFKITNTEKNLICDFHDGIVNIKFKTSKSLSENIKLFSFLNALINENCFYIGDVPIPTNKANFTNVSNSIKNHYDLYKKMDSVFRELKVTKEPSFDDVTDNDVEKILVLYDSIFNKKPCEITKNDSGFACIKTFGLNIYVFCAIVENKKYILDWTSIKFDVTFENNKHSIVSPYYVLSNVDANLFNSIDNIDYSLICDELFSDGYVAECNSMIYEVVNNLLDFYLLSKNTEALNAAENIIIRLKSLSADDNVVGDLLNRLNIAKNKS